MTRFLFLYPAHAKPHAQKKSARAKKITATPQQKHLTFCYFLFIFYTLLYNCIQLKVIVIMKMIMKVTMVVVVRVKVRVKMLLLVIV